MIHYGNIHMYEKHNGMLEIKPEMLIQTKDQLEQVYTPSIADISMAISENNCLKDKITLSDKLVAVVTDGSAVLGLGNIGACAGLPVVEAKSLIYKSFAGVDAIPIAVRPVSIDEFVDTITNISLSFSGIHLEDIAAPNCFEIERRLNKQLNIPVYHDDQEGTAIVVLAALINATKVVGKKLKDLNIVINGIGAGGVATAQLLLSVGITKLTLVDKDGIIKKDSPNHNKYQTNLAKLSQVSPKGSTLSEAIEGKDVFIGLSVSNVLRASHIRKMASDPIIFALANPIPEIDPITAEKAGAAVVATGSSQYVNQINNILVFPGLFKGILSSGVKHVSMKLQVIIAREIASMISDPNKDNIIPTVFKSNIVNHVSQAVKNYTN